MSQIAIIRKEILSSGTVNFFRDALPAVSQAEAGKVAGRFAKILYTTISNSPQLQRCTVQSIIKAAGISASLGLDIDMRGLAWLVPYKNKDTGALEASFQIGYQGLVELAYRSGKVKAISAHCIYESEADNVRITRENGRYSVHHPFSYKEPSGKMIAVYATAEVEGFGSFTEVLRVDEVEKVRRGGKAPNSPAWTQHFEAMAKKTAIRRLAKFLPKSIAEDFTRAAAADEKQDIIDVPSSRFERPAETAIEEPERQQGALEQPEEDDMPMDYPEAAEVEPEPEKERSLFGGGELVKSKKRQRN